MGNAVLDVKNLLTQYYTGDGVISAVNDVSFSIPKGQTVCLVGESGCGKSAVAMSIMGLIDAGSGGVKSGEILFEGKDLLKMKKHELRQLRGNDMSMIFQEPMTSLNPVLTIGGQIMEPLMEHELISKKEAKKRALELIELVGIGRAEEIFNSYPHQLSGGMLQRIMIAIALACSPNLLIADEPTTALDVTIQAQILDLLRSLKEQREMSMLLITHDLGVVAEVADYVIVMYAGKIIEEGPVVELFKNPKHPYTKGLLKAKPVINQRQEELYTIAGQVPNLATLTPSCYFSERCEQCMAVCKEQIPEIRDLDNGQRVACWLYEEVTIG
ncbi:ABC transporter ATP-binding protein [Metasolibacillus meyeri]|uniref:ABC transporter ATP-binding protein n=1 Tax=Metasolibacillus meyeri TaxID=1071052 RepID=A0AAW9NX67_9BACL|nr:ABC transporter ATP-binding protein [Metasolibacillus meyeri]MEC1180234.1 ABC transporter ATP-binding protein [Metasolibacillus meyeri]